MSPTCLAMPHWAPSAAGTASASTKRRARAGNGCGIGRRIEQPSGKQDNKTSSSVRQQTGLEQLFIHYRLVDDLIPQAHHQLAESQKRANVRKGGCHVRQAVFGQFIV